MKICYVYYIYYYINNIYIDNKADKKYSISSTENYILLLILKFMHILKCGFCPKCEHFMFEIHYTAHHNKCIADTIIQ